MKQEMRALKTSSILVLLLLLGACSKGASDADQARAALAAGLKAHQAGHFAEAVADYRKALIYDPRNKFAYYNLGLIDQTEGDSSSAESNYRITLSIDPQVATQSDYHSAVPTTAAYMPDFVVVNPSSQLAVSNISVRAVDADTPPSTGRTIPVTWAERSLAR